MSNRLANNFQFIDIGRNDPDKKALRARKSEYVEIYKPFTKSLFEGIEIQDDVILSPGSKILCKEGILKVRNGTVIGANAVLTESTGEWEIWAGIPAKCVGKRDQ